MKNMIATRHQGCISSGASLGAAVVVLANGVIFIGDRTDHQASDIRKL